MKYTKALYAGLTKRPWGWTPPSAPVRYHDVSWEEQTRRLEAAVLKRERRAAKRRAEK